MLALFSISLWDSFLFVTAGLAYHVKGNKKKCVPVDNKECRLLDSLQPAITYRLSVLQIRSACKNRNQSWQFFLTLRMNKFPVPSFPLLPSHLSIYKLPRTATTPPMNPPISTTTTTTTLSMLIPIASTLELDVSGLVGVAVRVLD